MTPRFLSELTWTRHCHSERQRRGTRHGTRPRKTKSRARTPRRRPAPFKPRPARSKRVRHAATPAGSPRGTVDPARAVPGVEARAGTARRAAPVSGGCRRPGREISASIHAGGCGFIPQNALKNAQLPNRQSTPKVRTNAALVWQLSRYFAFSEYLFGRHVLSLARDADGATWPPPSSTQLPLAGSSTAMQLGIAFAMPWPGIRRARCSAQSHPSFQTRKASPRR